jgi:hypothetical protein
VDLTATSGDGGRGFTGKIFISGSNADGTPANVGLFNNYLKSNYTLTKPFTIPSRVFTVGATYHVDLELCNFFLQCNWGNFTLTISVPPVVVVAGASRSVRSIGKLHQKIIPSNGDSITRDR